MTALTYTARKIADASRVAAQCAIVPLFSGKKPGAAGHQNTFNLPRFHSLPFASCTCQFTNPPADQPANTLARPNEF